MRGAFPKVYQSFQAFERDELNKLQSLDQSMDRMMDEMMAKDHGEERRRGAGGRREPGEDGILFDKY